MGKKKITLAWGLMDDENDTWRFYFGCKGGTLVYSPRLFAKEIALNWVNAEIQQAKDQFGNEYEVTVERKDVVSAKD